MEQMKPPPPPQEKSSLGEKMKQLEDMQIEMRKSQHQFENETRTCFNNQAAKLKWVKWLHYSMKGNMVIFLVLQKSTQGEMERSTARLWEDGRNINPCSRRQRKFNQGE